MDRSTQIHIPIHLPSTQIHIPIHLPRGFGKTQIARGWARSTVKALGAKSLLVACQPGHGVAESFRHALRQDDHDLFERIRVHAAQPQRDEFRLQGIWCDVAVCENIDMWPLVPITPGDFSGERHSILMEEILARTNGPILCTFSKREGLAQLMWPTIATLTASAGALSYDDDDVARFVESNTRPI